MEWINLIVGFLIGFGCMFVLCIWAIGRMDQSWEERTGLRSHLASDDRERGVLS